MTLELTQDAEEDASSAFEWYEAQRAGLGLEPDPTNSDRQITTKLSRDDSLSGRDLPPRHQENARVQRGSVESELSSFGS
jgi:hypothetical protein